MKDSLQRLRRRLACRDPEDWDERVAREMARQGRIEAAFDQAAEALSGDLPPTYRARRAQMFCDVAERIEIGAGG